MGFNEYISDFISLFFPRLCIGCDIPLPRGSVYICPKCHYNLPKTNTHTLEVPQFAEKFQGIVDVDSVWVYCYFNKKGIIQKLLHELKYGNQPEIGIMLGKWYGHNLSKAGLIKSFDLIVPIPLHSNRMKERGYNQSEYFALGMSKVTGLPVNTTDLIKVKHIDSLTKKSKVNRIIGTKGVFDLVNESTFSNKGVLLVDDVLTTGSTLISAIETLKISKPKVISIATIGGVK